MQPAGTISPGSATFHVKAIAASPAKHEGSGIAHDLAKLDGRSMQRLLREVDDPRWRLSLAVSPDREGLQSRVSPAHLPRLAQGRGDLGDRMGRLLRGAPPGPVCIVGADIPGIRRSHIVRAFSALGRHEAVFGPAHDGGYWLVVLKRTGAVPATLFRGVRWSSRMALADTVDSLGDRRVGFVDTLRDVDTVADLRG